MPTTRVHPCQERQHLFLRTGHHPQNQEAYTMRQVRKRIILDRPRRLDPLLRNPRALVLDTDATSLRPWKGHHQPPVQRVQPVVNLLRSSTRLQMPTGRTNNLRPRGLFLAPKSRLPLARSHTWRAVRRPCMIAVRRVWHRQYRTRCQFHRSPLAPAIQSMPRYRTADRHILSPVDIAPSALVARARKLTDGREFAHLESPSPKSCRLTQFPRRRLHLRD